MPKQKLQVLENQVPRKIEHFSFSSLKTWKFCPFSFKLEYIERLSGFEGNEHSTFGNAMHGVCESVLLQEKPGVVDEVAEFKKLFKEELAGLPKNIRQSIKKTTINEMMQQGERLAPLAVPALMKHFPGLKVFSVEEQLYEPIEYADGDYSFKGYIDLVIQTPDGKYHIIDWKTCSWGWDLKKRSDPMVTYQLTLYKHFFAKRYKIDPANIETHFALLKRTPGKGKDSVEIFRVTSGARKTANALKLLDECVYNVDHGRHIKNRLSCGRCPHHRTPNCP